MVARRDGNKSERSDVKRTRKAITDAYRDLLFKKPYDKITVTDVINEANISRGTFYAYYSDIHDLAEFAEDQMISQMIDLVKDVTLDHLLEEPRRMIEIIALDLEKYRDAVRTMFEKNNGLKLHEKLKYKLKKALLKEFIDINETEKTILISCILGGVLECCIDWTLSNKPYDREILIDTITGFVSEGTAFLRKDR